MAARKPYKVTKVNPAKKKRAKKKTAKKKTAKRKSAKKKATKKKPARKRKTVAKKKKKTTRRRRRPATKKRAAPRRSRSNPTLSIDAKAPFMRFLPRLIGQVVTVGMVRKFGDMSAAGFGGAYSPTTGAAWTFKNYGIAYVTALVGGELLSRFGGKKAWGQAFYDGGVELTNTKLMWTEIIGRVPMLQAMLGNHEGNSMKALAAQAEEGDIITDNGTTWLLQNGEWVSMQGHDPYTPKALAGHDPYKPAKLNGQAVEADYLGGVLTQADYLDGALREATPMGHQMPPGTSRRQATASQYRDTGSPDPYHNVYQQ